MLQYLYSNSKLIQRLQSGSKSTLSLSNTAANQWRMQDFKWGGVLSFWNQPPPSLVIGSDLGGGGAGRWTDLDPSSQGGNSRAAGGGCGPEGRKEACS